MTSRPINSLPAVFAFGIFLFMLSQSVFSQIAIEVDIEEGWRNSCDSEELGDRRLIRFAGFVEGYFKIREPALWSSGRDSLLDSNTDGVSTRSFTKGELLRLVPDQDDYSLFVEFFTENNDLAWTAKLTNIFQDVVLTGICVVRAKIAANDVHILVFGRLGELRFLQVLERKSGSRVVNFCFIPSSEKNFAGASQ
jgi:hypothetical protein